MTGREVTVGVDIGTTAVKALAVDRDGRVLARVRVPHRIVTTEPDRLEHDARRAWRQGPRRAFRAVVAELAGAPAGVAVASVVPSLTAVDGRGHPVLPGLLYGDSRGTRHTAPGPWGEPGDASGNGGDGLARSGGRRSEETAASPFPPTDPADGAVGPLATLPVEAPGGLGLPDAVGFLRWAVGAVPDAAGYWPAQAVATQALAGVAAMDGAAATAFGRLHGVAGWRGDALCALGVRTSQLPIVAPMGQTVGAMPGSETVVAAGTVDALCDQLVNGGTEPGDVLAIFGATLVVWVVTDRWLAVPGLVTVPHSAPGRVLVGGPSNAGALFVDWARSLLGTVRSAPRRARRVGALGDWNGAAGAERGRVGNGGGDVCDDGRSGDPRRVPVWLPYVRGERVLFDDPMLRASVHGLDLTHGPSALARGAYEASGFVIRQVIERSGLPARRIVASGGGSGIGAWMAAVADATGLPVDTVAVPDGAAYGAAFLARVAAGLERTVEEARRWARTGQRISPCREWARAAAERFGRFEALGPGR